VQSNEWNGHWCEQEGKEAFKIIQRIIEQTHSLPDLYIISPFKVVADKMKKLLKDKSKYLESRLKPVEKSMLSNWIYKSVGTIHAFQGKQSEGVILLLGGDPSMLCARYTSPPLRQMRSPLYTNFFVSYCHPPF
jgi:hypothetical protein